ncbi:hypothetical protein PVT71_09315 [Salipiger sp. H15]|uniref:Uncharacterized protein n=1 Tax=Alloyangia sp. H15 TaxID=3029062 RepID=A0AAU8ADP1_9RHOB
MKYELLGGLGMLGALAVLLAMPGGAEDREILQSTVETARERVSADFFGPQ